VTVGLTLPDGQVNHAAIIHLVKFGSGRDAPWEVVGTDDTTLTLDIPAYGGTATSPVRIGGKITGVDESLRAEVRQLGSGGPGGRLLLPAGRRPGYPLVTDCPVPRRVRPGDHHRGAHRRPRRGGGAVRGHRRPGRLTDRGQPAVHVLGRGRTGRPITAHRCWGCCATRRLTCLIAGACPGGRSRTPSGCSNGHGRTIPGTFASGAAAGHRRMLGS